MTREGAEPGSPDPPAGSGPAAPLLPPPPPWVGSPPPPWAGPPPTIGAPGPWAAWAALPAPRVPLIGGRAPVRIAGLLAVFGAALLGASLAAGLRALQDLPPDLAGSPADRGPYLPTVAAVTIAAVAVALLAGRRWLRAVAMGIGCSSAGSLLARVEASSPGRASGLRAARRTALAATCLATVGAVLVGAGIVGRLVAGDRTISTAGAIVAFVGVVAILLAAGIVPSLLGAVTLREVDAASSRGSGPTPVPRAPSPITGVLGAIAVACMLLLPLAGSSAPVTVCDLGAPWRCADVLVRADHGGKDAYAEAIGVAYAVHPASDLRDRPRRVLLIATGGPGSSGIEDGAWMVDWLDPRVTERFDVVTFDARGVGGTDGRDCPRAARSYGEQPIEASTARTFAEACVVEAGAAGLDLRRFGTDAVVEDIEAVRIALGVGRISLYGISYGTVVGQSYAVAHPDRVDALVLDAPVDRGVPSGRMWVTAAHGFVDAVEATLDACSSDVGCSEALPHAAHVYQDVLDRFARVGELRGSVVGPDGKPHDRVMTATDFAGLTSAAMYDTTSRMSWLRALAGMAADDVRPLLRLNDAWAGPDTGSWFAYYATWCADAQVGPADRPGDFGAFAQAADDAGLTDDDALDTAMTLAPCVFWPGQQDAPETRPVPTGVPTLILGSTADPITTIEGARSLLRSLPDARLIETDGGGHGSLGDQCPNERIADFLVDGRLPLAETSICRGWVADAFMPLAVSPATAADDAIEGLFWELLGAPEVLQWDGVGTLRIGCGEGGTALFKATGEGWRAAVTFEGCSWAQGATFDGSGWMDLASWSTALVVSSPRGELNLVATSSTWRLTGRWDGRVVDVDD